VVTVPTARPILRAMKLIAIQASDASQGEFIFGAVQDALATERAFFDDAALVLTDAEGVHITHTKGRFGRMFGSGIADDQAKRILAQGPAGGALVLALGAPEAVDALALRARTITKGDLHTFEVVGDELRELTGQDATYALDDSASALHEEPGNAFAEGNLPDNRLDRP
jgi:hypothetical protein